MKHTYPNLIIDTPAPGHYVIYGHKPQPVDTDEGRVVPLDQCYITDGIPSELLMDIIRERHKEAVVSGCMKEVLKIKSGAYSMGAIPLPDPMPPPPPMPDGPIGEVGPIGSIGIPGLSLKDAILSKLKENPSIRVKALAELVGCTVEDIKDLTGAGFAVGNAGWVKLTEEGAE